MQGKAFDNVCAFWRTRITPACAGKRNLLNLFDHFVQDHPCVCREKSSKIPPLATTSGSPLRVQGKVRNRNTNQRKYRITPACAGKRLKNPRKIAVLFFANFKYHLVLSKPHSIICNRQQPYASAYRLCQEIRLRFPTYSFPNYLSYF